jgi:hypothetical protein
MHGCQSSQYQATAAGANKCIAEQLIAHLLRKILKNRPRRPCRCCCCCSFAPPPVPRDGLLALRPSSLRRGLRLLLSGSS